MYGALCVFLYSFSAHWAMQCSAVYLVFYSLCHVSFVSSSDLASDSPCSICIQEEGKQNQWQLRLEEQVIRPTFVGSSHTDTRLDPYRLLCIFATLVLYLSSWFGYKEDPMWQGA